MVNRAKITSFELTKETAYLVGVIIGDGSIGASLRTFPPKDELDPVIYLENGNEEFLRQVIKPIIDKLLHRQCKIIERKPRGIKWNSTWVIRFRSKYFHKFLTEQLGLPKGKKAHKVSLQVILSVETRPEIINELIAGIFDTDGGLRGKGIGQSTASKKLRDEITALIVARGIKAYPSQWLNKKYFRNYYEWKIRSKKEIGKFIQTIPLRNSERVKKIKEKFEV